MSTSASLREYSAIDLLGDPRSFPPFDQTELQNGDLVVLITTSPGGIYFMRPDPKRRVLDALDHEIIMAVPLFGRKATLGMRILKNLVAPHFTLNFRLHREHEGVVQTYFSVHQQAV